jgi:hypothetical protein
MDDVIAKQKEKLAQRGRMIGISSLLTSADLKPDDTEAKLEKTSLKEVLEDQKSF